MVAGQRYFPVYFVNYGAQTKMTQLFQEQQYSFFIIFINPMYDIETLGLINQICYEFEMNFEHV